MQSKNIFFNFAYTTAYHRLIPRELKNLSNSSTFPCIDCAREMYRSSKIPNQEKKKLDHEKTYEWLLDRFRNFIPRCSVITNE